MYNHQANKGKLNHSQRQLLMLTMKFFHHGGSKTVISCARYFVLEQFPETLIYAYPSHKEENPQIFCLEMSPKPESKSLYEVFIENGSGKTIDRYRALSSDPNLNMPYPLTVSGCAG